jgi:serralysin
MAAANVAEHATAVTTIAASDISKGGTQTYSIVGGADAARFSINSTIGVLSFVAARDYELPSGIGGNNVYDVIGVPRMAPCTTSSRVP